MDVKLLIPYRTGDVVKYIGPDSYGWDHGEEMIVKEVELTGPQSFEYSTNKGAWLSHEELTLIREADLRSLTDLYKDELDEEEM